MNRIKEIKEAYYLVNNHINNNYNDSELRLKVQSLLEILLRNKVDKIVCDETNNTPDVIDKNILCARVCWKGSGGLNSGYMDLVFGDVDIVWPEEKEFIEDEPKNIELEIKINPSSNKVFLIDIDGTVCDDIKNEDSHLYPDAEVIPGALEIINKWYSEGNVITFFTARESKDREVTEQWLSDNGFNYHGLVMDKPRIKDGQEYCWIDNRKVRAVTYLGTWGELKEVDAKIQTFG